MSVNNRNTGAGGGNKRVELSQVAAQVQRTEVDVLEVDEVLTKLEGAYQSDAIKVEKVLLK